MSQITVLGYANAAAPPEVKRAAYLRMLEHAERSELGLHTVTAPLDAIAEVWERQKSAGGVKLVILP
jgi:hypothetical protein